MCPYWSLQFLLRPYGFQSVFVGPYLSLFVLTESNGSLGVHVGPYSSLWILNGSYGPLLRLMFIASYCVLMFLWALIAS